MTDEDLSPWVTRREIADAIWPDVSESVRDGLAKSDVVDRVYDLVNGTGGAS